MVYYSLQWEKTHTLSNHGISKWTGVRKGLPIGLGLVVGNFGGGLKEEGPCSGLVAIKKREYFSDCVTIKLTYNID